MSDTLTRTLDLIAMSYPLGRETAAFRLTASFTFGRVFGGPGVYAVEVPVPAEFPTFVAQGSAHDVDGEVPRAARALYRETLPLLVSRIRDALTSTAEKADRLAAETGNDDYRAEARAIRMLIEDAAGADTLTTLLNDTHDAVDALRLTEALS